MFYSCFFFLFLIHLTPLTPKSFSTYIKQNYWRDGNGPGEKAKKPRKWTTIMIRTWKKKLWYKQKPTESTKSCSQLLSENNIVLFGCGQSRISLSAPHWELWYQPNPRGNEKRQGYKQRLACLFVMRRKTAVSVWCTGFLVLEQWMYSIASCVR